jgi:bifunctional UDP-N-acetylglucosamine pyrophosphorylase / glucosamine-1-phosphate N-acetyltransferase
VALEIVVLAAGQGKRMRSAVPKVLQPIGGKPMLAHVLETARALEPARIHVVYGHGGDDVKTHFMGWDIDWCEQAEQLGTGHALLQAMPGIGRDNRVLVLCGDVPLVRAATLSGLIGESDSPVTVLTARVADPTGYGRVVRDTNGVVAGIVEQKDATPEQQAIDEVNTGIMVIDGEPLHGWLSRLRNDNAQAEYYLTDIIAMAVADGRRVAGVPADNPREVFGINDKKQLAATEREYQRRLAEALLERGATIADPARLDIRGEVEIGTDVEIDVGVILEGRVRLGNNVHIGPHCIIRDCDLGDGTVVEAHCHLEGARAEGGSTIGPFARVRPGTLLKRGARLGNFVEIKQSEIAEGSKVNHLTYIGDASVGAHVNVGAGTVTCNYDGANKSQTVIGANAFIGSGTMLVAPVKVGEGATIGAGSTITKDAPPEKLTLARARQTTVDGWKRPAKKPK